MEERLTKGMDYLRGLEEAGKMETLEYWKWFLVWWKLLFAYEESHRADSWQRRYDQPTLLGEHING